MKTVVPYPAHVKTSDAELTYYWYLSFPGMSTDENEVDGFSFDECMFERALEDIENNPELYDSFSG